MFFKVYLGNIYVYYVIPCLLAWPQVNEYEHLIRQNIFIAIVHYIF